MVKLVKLKSTKMAGMENHHIFCVDKHQNFSVRTFSRILDKVQHCCVPATCWCALKTNDQVWYRHFCYILILFCVISVAYSQHFALSQLIISSYIARFYHLNRHGIFYDFMVLSYVNSSDITFGMFFIKETEIK